jgi:predicted permease
MPSVATDLKYVIRRLTRSPMFSAITLTTLALGIGANTAIFSVINGVLLKPLPYKDADRLVGVWQTAPGLGIPRINASPATYFTYREESKTFEDIGIWRGDAVTMTGLAEPEHAPALQVSDGVLPILGVQPIRGRWFSKKDDSPGAPDTVMLTYDYWQTRFGGDTSVVGRRITLDAKPYEVIGIMPANFRFLDYKPSLILPLRLNRSEAFVGNFSFFTLARLKPGVTIQQANADVARMLSIMVRKFKPAPGMSVTMLEQAKIGPDLSFLKQDVIGDISKVLWVLMATVGIVLFIACANVANLLLVRVDARQEELAIRAALGAGWTHIARELLLESVMLGVVGGLLGIAVAYGALRLLVALGPSRLPRLAEISIDPVVLAFTFVISIAAGALFGLVPVFKYARRQLGTALRQGGRTSSDGRERHRARSVLVVVQVALALVLLITSGLMIRTMQGLRNVKPGFEAPEQVLTLRVSIADAQVQDPVRVVRMHNDIIQKIETVPGVRSVAAMNSVTMDGFTDNDPVYAEDHVYSESALPVIRRYKFVTPNSFKTMGNPLIAGRDFTWTDVYEKRPVVVMSEALARELWHDPTGAIGKRVRENPKAKWREVIGVVGNDRDDGVDKKPTTTLYWPIIVADFWGMPFRVERTLAFVIRSDRTGSAAFLKDIQKAIWSVNPDLPLADVRTLAEIYNKSMARTSFTLVMLSLASGLALVLGLIGIYGVISYSVSQRTREIGIRMALGAQASEVRQLFVRHGLVLSAIGVVCGVLAAASVTRLMSALLFDVSPLDPVTYGAVSLILLAAALLATYVPARRATNIEPVQALRTE